MSSRFCTKCGSVASDGQKFCKICGQPLPVAAPAHEAVADPVFRPREPWGAVESPGRDTGVTLAVKTCTKCQTVLTPDQRSCWVCGQPVSGAPVTGAVELAEIPVPASGMSAAPSPMPTPNTTWTPVAEPDPSTIVPAAPATLLTCAQCHTVLAAGQQSCWACGLPVNAGPAVAAQPATPAPAQSASSFTAMWSEVAVGPVPTVPVEPVPVSDIPAQAAPVPSPTYSSTPDSWATAAPVFAESAVETPAAAPALLTCANCQAALAEGQRFCRLCGTPVAAAPAMEAPANPIVAEPSGFASASSSAAATAAFSASPGWGDVAATPVEAQPASSAASTPSTCSKCGSALTPGQGICWVCGQTVGAAPLESTPSTMSTASTSAASEPYVYQPLTSESLASEPLTIAPSAGWSDTPVASPGNTAPEPAAAYRSAPPAAEATLTCTKCAGALTPGQKFCRLCGQPVAAVAAVVAAGVAERKAGWPAESVLPETSSPEAASTPPQPEAAWNSTPAPAAPATSAPVVASPSGIASAPAPETTRCPTCRTVLTAEQRVCWVCGQVLGVIGQHETLAEMGAPTETYKEVAVAIPEAAKTSPVVPAPLQPQSYSSQPAYSAPTAGAQPSSGVGGAAAAYQPVAPVIPVTLPPIGAQRADFQPVSAVPYSAPPAAPVAPVPVNKQSNAGLWILLIVLLLGAGGAGAWLYMRGAKTQTVASTSAAAAASSSGQAAPASQPDPPPPPPLAPLNSAGSGATPAPLPKPSAAGSTIDSGASTPPLPSKQAPATHSAPASSLASAPTPKFNPNQSVPPLDPMPKPQSGTLHYSGPPIPQNGVVVFDHLPGGRLRFSYDQSIWHPTIVRNPDGTQKLILRSSSPGSQTECVVQWQQIP